MSKPITAKIDVTKIAKEHLFVGKKRQDGTTPKYLDLAIWPNKDGPDQYGNTHYITQSISKAAREAGGRGAIIGNMSMPVDPYSPPPPPWPDNDEKRMAGTRPATGKAPAVEPEDDDIPF